MQFSVCVCVLLVLFVAVTLVDGKKTFSSRRKSGNNRRGGSSSSQPKPPPPQPSSTHHKTDTNTNFLNSERAGSSHGIGSINTHHRQSPFNNKPPEPPKQSVPQTNGPIGFEKINSEVQRKPATPNVPSAPAYPAGSPPYMGSGTGYPGKPANAPHGPPPAYPGYSNPGTGFDPPPAYPGRPVNAPPVYSANNPPSNFGQRSPVQSGVGGYPNQQGGFAPQGSYPGQSYQGQQNFGYPNSGGNFGQSYPGQQGFGYSNPGGGFGNYPNQGFGSYPGGGFGNAQHGGYGQSYSGYGGSPFGGSPFGQSPSFGGGQHGSGGFGGNFFGGHGNSHYSPNNFGYSNNPGLFGSNSGYGGYNGMFGKHKKSRFGGLPIPIPIPIPIPLGGFGGFGGHSHNHRLLDSFVKNVTVSVSDNTTASVFILNNSTVTPCTTDQFIYDSLNITVMSCTTGNCTAVKVFVTSNVTQNVPVRSAGLTMCLEPHATFSTFGENVNTVVSDLHGYWMRVCREIVTVNSTNNMTDQTTPNVTVKVSEEVINETVISNNNSTEQSVQNVTVVPENGTSVITLGDTQNKTITSSESNTTFVNVNESTNTTNCELFNCSWIEMCLPQIEVETNCSSANCPPTKLTHQPCIRIKMCQSPSTPISTFATLNNTISRNQDNNITTFSDVANLTLISYIPPNLPTNCSQNATDPACQFPALSQPQEVCAPSNSSEANVPTPPTNSTLCIPPVTSEISGSTSTGITGVETPNSTVSPT